VASERSSDDILTEILYTTRAMDKRIRHLENSRNVSAHFNDFFERSEAMSDEGSVVKYQINVDPGIGVKDIEDALSKIIDLRLINVKKAGKNKYWVIAPNMEKDDKMIIRNILQNLEKKH